MSVVRTAEDIGAVIRARRRQLGCTQQDLADRAGLSRQSIVAIEQGKERAALAAVLRVLLELGLEADVFAPRTPSSGRRSRPVSTSRCTSADSRTEHPRDAAALRLRRRNPCRGARMRRRSSTFRYDRPYLARRTPTPLSLSLPVGPREYGPEAVEPFLWGLLPDNAETLRRWALDARPQADSTIRPALRLDCAGAVQFVRPENEATFERHGGLSRLSNTQIGAQIRAMNADPSRWTFDDRDGRFSLGGAQAKFGLLREDDAWALPTGATPTTHIVKPGDPGVPGERCQ